LSAIAFSFAHIVFRNPWAILFTFVGGLMFASTYLKTRSNLAASVEHALYGCFVFTIGIGQYFYAGPIR
jgi:membrane protease YdiL (CAAX protease family)